MNIDIVMFMPVLMALTIITNIVVQVLKSITYDKIPTNLLAFVVAAIVTAAALFIYVSIQGIAVTAWMIVAAVGVAFAVAFAAMFGFDKLKEMLEQWKHVDGRNQ